MPLFPRLARNMKWAFQQVFQRGASRDGGIGPTSTSPGDLIVRLERHASFESYDHVAHESVLSLFALRARGEFASTSSQWLPITLRRSAEALLPTTEAVNAFMAQHPENLGEELIPALRQRHLDIVAQRLPTDELKQDALGKVLSAILLHGGGFDSRESVVFRRVAMIDLKQTSEIVAQIERHLCESLEILSREHEVGKRRHSMTTGRALQIGAAGIVGGGMLAVTGVVSAPLLAVAATTTGAASLAAFLGTFYGTAAVAVVFGLYGAHRTAWKMVRRTAKLTEFFFIPLITHTRADTLEITHGEEIILQHQPNDGSSPRQTEMTFPASLRVRIGVCGWLLHKDLTPIADFWLRVFGSDPDGQRYQDPTRRVFEQYAVVFERKQLIDMGLVVQNMATDQAMQAVVQQAIGMSVGGAAMMSALVAPMAVMQGQDFVDSPWALAKMRAIHAGEELARSLLLIKGRRPVTLVGHAFGSVAIFFCLEKIADLTFCPEIPRAQRFGIVEDVVLFATPLRVTRKRWSRIREVVAGRFINAYCSYDVLMKGFLLVSEKIFDPAAAVEPIKVDGIEDIHIDDVDAKLGIDPSLMCLFLKRRGILC